MNRLHIIAIGLIAGLLLTGSILALLGSSDGAPEPIANNVGDLTTRGDQYTDPVAHRSGEEGWGTKIPAGRRGISPGFQEDARGALVASTGDSSAGYVAGSDLSRMEALENGAGEENRTASQDDLPETAETGGRNIVTVKGDAPGNSMVVSGQRVAVERTSLTEENETAMELTISSATSPQNQATSSTHPPSTFTGAAPGKFKVRGFTYEEELFRTKWGWTAFDQAQRAVRFVNEGTIGSNSPKD
jgi:hypothetical protein